MSLEAATFSAEEQYNERSRISRRRFLNATAVLGLTAGFVAEPLRVSKADTVKPAEVFRNVSQFYELVPPEGWEKLGGSLSRGRQIVAWRLPAPTSGDSGSGALGGSADGNIAVVTSPIPADFQKLTSFGSIENVADLIVPQDKALGGRMIRADTRRVAFEDGRELAYAFEYELRPTKTQPVKHLWTLFAIRPGQYVLTVTAQCPLGSPLEAEVRKAFDSVADSSASCNPRLKSRDGPASQRSVRQGHPRQDCRRLQRTPRALQTGAVGGAFRILATEAHCGATQPHREQSSAAATVPDKFCAQLDAKVNPRDVS
eukprot:CAMPEP_0185837222 /NCGR_PEP_ID=MMETSP1353-20130828/11024_1 /TAXON_ID=1077150 /ORGANISM="Erythrolobus australicus, Strain CCMP3124" /LENGTH=314 /DNA_ID=CAMNT_0028536115 /DNA_START=74 /DNA_END=1015 /DNA_ORIENTATION=+